MTTEQMIDRYNYLYALMKESKDVKNMKIFGEAEKYMFRELAKVHPEMARNWLAHLEATEWNNYLDESEAVNIGKTMINEDGVQGFHWGHDTFVSSMGRAIMGDIIYMTGGAGILTYDDVPYSF